MLNIIIDEKTSDYILKKGGILTMEKIIAGSSWASVPVLKVGFGEPETINNYNFYEINNIKIYISKSLTLKGDNLRIQLNSFMKIFKKINVTGLNLV